MKPTAKGAALKNWNGIALSGKASDQTAFKCLSEDAKHDLKENRQRACTRHESTESMSKAKALIGSLQGSGAEQRRWREKWASPVRRRPSCRKKQPC